MSKRIGNVVDPMAVIAESGADALRWYFCVNNPEQPARFSARLVRDAAQSFLLPLWNALSFFSIYANLDGWRPGRPEPAFAERPALDRWILLRLATVVRDTTVALDDYRIADASRAIAAFVDDLTNWYIRRSRDRFWAETIGSQGSGADKESAYQALYEVLTTLARLLAPFTPFVAEVLHRNLVRSLDAGAAASVHLEDWPAPARGREEPALEDEHGPGAAHRAVRPRRAQRARPADAPAARERHRGGLGPRTGRQGRALPRPGARRAQRARGPFRRATRRVRPPRRAAGLSQAGAALRQAHAGGEGGARRRRRRLCWPNSSKPAARSQSSSTASAWRSSRKRSRCG